MLLNIEHITATTRPSGATAITADEGYVFYDSYNYRDLTDEEGNPREPLPEEILYFRYKVFARSVTAAEIEDRLVVLPESEVPADQIFGTGNDHVIA